MATLQITRGDAERIEASVTPASAAATGLRFMAKRKYRDADADAIIDKTIGSGITITQAGSPTVPATALIEIDPADTQPLANKEIELLAELEDGEDHTLAKVTLKVLPKVILDELEV